MSIKTVQLEFYNVDATPPVTRLVVSRESIDPIMAWYGAYFAGDEYAVMVDGKEIPIDLNGERQTPLIDADLTPAPSDIATGEIG